MGKDGKSGLVVQAGTDFAAPILVCVVAGWLLDTYMDTQPWGIAGMTLLGFAVGFFNVWRALNPIPNRHSDNNDNNP